MWIRIFKYPQNSREKDLRMFNRALALADDTVKAPYQFVANWVFTHFGKSHYWLAMMCAHFLMACIMIDTANNLLHSRSALNMALAGLALLIWLTAGYSIVIRTRSLDEAWKVGRVPKFTPLLFSFEFRLLRLMNVGLPAFFLLLWTARGISPPLAFAGSAFALASIQYFGICDPPSSQRKERMAQNFT